MTHSKRYPVLCDRYVTSSFHWFTVVSVSFVIGYGDNFE